ncbi:MAG: disulfide bond formation protein B [Ghiorsea sp.]
MYISPPMNTPTTNISHSWLLLFSAWLIATIATLASLFFSEVMHLIPCSLCWYQRILMFPLSMILLIGLYPLDTKVIRYALPFSILGIAFTLYHSLLFYGFIPESLKPCTQGVPCDDDSMVLFDFLPIPLLSLAAFMLITVLLFIAQPRIKK